MVTLLDVLVIGLALASVWFWLAVLIGLIFRAETVMERLKWWLVVIVPQGIIIALALRVLHWL